MEATHISNLIENPRGRFLPSPILPRLCVIRSIISEHVNIEQIIHNFIVVSSSLHCIPHYANGALSWIWSFFPMYYWHRKSNLN